MTNTTPTDPDHKPDTDRDSRKTSRTTRDKKPISGAEMTVKERMDLTRLAEKRAKVAKAHIDVYAKQRRADFEDEISAIYDFDNEEVWKAAVVDAARIVQEAIAQANDRVAARCDELGIPSAFRPSIRGGAHWYSRGENLVNERRVELRRKAETRIAALAAEAKTAIDTATLEVTTALLSEGITSEAGKAYLERLPQVADLMPRIEIGQLKDVIPKDAKRERWTLDYDARHAIEAKYEEWTAEAGVDEGDDE